MMPESSTNDESDQSVERIGAGGGYFVPQIGPFLESIFTKKYVFSGLVCRVLFRRPFFVIVPDLGTVFGSENL